MVFIPVELMFHDGTGSWATFVDKAIRIVSKKTHVELRLPDGRSFSSTQRKEMMGDVIRNGVRFSYISYTHPERWEKVVLWLTEEEYQKVLWSCEVLASLEIPYDYRGAAGTAITGGNVIFAYFCSEVVYDVLFTLWMSCKLNYKMHPDRLLEIAKKVEKVLIKRKEILSGC